MKALILTSIAALCLMGCVTDQDSDSDPSANNPPEGQNGFSVADQTACLGKDGTYRRRGMLGAYSCALPYADAGKTCTRPSQCEGDCRIENYDNSGDAPSSGTCQATSDPFGCNYKFTEDGQIVGLCVD